MRFLPRTVLLLVTLAVSSPTFAGQLYWSDPFTDQILTGPLSGNGPVREVFSRRDYPGAPGYANPHGLVVDGNFVYWGDVEAHFILRGRRDGAGVPERMYAGFSLGRPNSLAVDEDYLYWTSGSGVYRGEKQGESPPMKIFSTGELPGGIVVDDQFVYWSEWGYGGIFRGPKSGAARSKRLFDTLPTTAGIGIDDQYLYWNNVWDGQLVRSLKDGTGAIEVLFDHSDGLVDARHVVVVGDYLYTGDIDTGQILRGAVDGSGPLVPIYAGSDYPGMSVVGHPSYLAFAADVPEPSPIILSLLAICVSLARFSRRPCPVG